MIWNFYKIKIDGSLELIVELNESDAAYYISSNSKKFGFEEITHPIHREEKHFVILPIKLAKSFKKSGIVLQNYII